jgi:hypothetical protein
MPKVSWKITLGVSLIVCSAVLYLVHFLVFRDAHHIFIYLLGDIAFLPVEVLLVTLVVHQLLSEREKRVLLKKLNMVIGAFFSEVGMELLTSFIGVDAAAPEKREKLAAPGTWREDRIKELADYLTSCDCRVQPGARDFETLKAQLASKREFMLRLLENPNLLEHELFTEMLWAVFHLTEELEAREDFSKLPASDIKHIEGDLKRAYTVLTVEWLHYMSHLKRDYPYLFSLAVRMNPFDAGASVVVTQETTVRQ